MIRVASESDWAAIWPILRDIAEAGATYTYPRNLDAATARTVWHPGDAGTVFVATDPSGQVVGSAKVGANQMGPGGHVATASFIVAVGARRAGIGRALGRAAIDWAREAGFRAMQFNAVVATNTAAVTLWQALGFVVVGTVPAGFMLPSGDFAALLVMHRAL